MALVPAKISLNWISNYKGEHRICYKLATDIAYTCTLPGTPGPGFHAVCGGAGDPCSYDIIIMIDDETCDSLAYDIYVQPACETEASLTGRVVLSPQVVFTPTPVCNRYDVTCASVGIVSGTVTAAGSGYTPGTEAIVVVGGGNTAVEEALFLTNFASKVTLIHRRNELRAEQILINRLMKNEKIQPMWFHEIEEVYGSEAPLGVEGVKVKHTKTGEITNIPCKGVFIAIGHSPANELVIDTLETHMGGYVVTKPDSTETSIPGVFASGDLTDHKYRQAVTSAGMGCMAALEAERWLAEQKQ